MFVLKISLTQDTEEMCIMPIGSRDWSVDSVVKGSRERDVYNTVMGSKEKNVDTEVIGSREWGLWNIVSH